MRKGGAWLPVCAAVLLSAGCGVHVPPESQMVAHYAEGVQNIHQLTYEDSFLACHPEAKVRLISERLGEYKVARDSGTVTFSPDGVEVIKLGVLGWGAYFRVSDVVNEGDTLRFRTIVKPGYPSINFSAYPERARLFILGEPLGTVVTLRPGQVPGPERTILESVDLEWIWTKLPAGSPVEWCLQSVLPVPGSATFKKMQFREVPGVSP